MSESRTLPDDMDALCLRTSDRDAILAAIDATCRDEGLVPAPAARLRPHGQFLHGEEDPSLRRFLIEPAPGRGEPRGIWTVVLLSAQDWDHAWAPRLLARLPVRAAYLMLHDGDTCTLHAYEGPDLLAELVTSRLHFDLPPAPPDPRLRAALERLSGRTLTETEVQRTCFPPGRIDVDGRLAHARIRELLQLPASCCGTYAAALDDDRRGPGPSHAGWIHACWQDSEDFAADEAFERRMAEGLEDAAEEPGVPADVLPFRRPDGEAGGG